MSEKPSAITAPSDPQNHRVTQRFAQPAFALHDREGFDRTAKDHHQSIDERIDERAALAVFPR